MKEQFEVLEWSTEHERDLFQRTYPDVDIQLYPRSCVSIVTALLKLVNYGGISVRGEDIAPIRGIKILITDWKSLGPPAKLTVRGYAHPIFVDKSTIMTCSAGDPVAKSYLDKLVACMRDRTWEHPVFGPEVGIMQRQQAAIDIPQIKISNQGENIPLSGMFIPKRLYNMMTQHSNIREMANLSPI